MNLFSYSRLVSKLEFPDFKGLQKYMLTTLGEAVVFPNPFKEYEPIVQDLCDRLDYKDLIHVTIDEKALAKGQTQRKPGPHVDGRFSNGEWGHSTTWNHYCNELPVERMAIAVASSVAACKVYHGQFEGTPTEQGDLSHIADQLGEGSLVPANEWHLLTPDCVHESLPMVEDVRRQFLRVAFEERVAV